jgi:hypothetical protein
MGVIFHPQGEITVVRVSCDLLMRFTVWKLDKESKLKERADLEEAELADDTDDTPKEHEF